MKKLFFMAVLATVFFTGSAVAQGNCASTTLDVPNIQQVETVPGMVQATYTLTWDIQGNASRTIEVIVNGNSHFMTVSGNGAMQPDLSIPTGSTLTVTVITYSSPKPEKGKICSIQTATGYPI